MVTSGTSTNTQVASLFLARARFIKRNNVHLLSGGGRLQLL